LFGLTPSPTANLVTDTDPFPAGDFYPDDSSIQIHIEKSYLLSLAGDLGAKYPAITDPTPTLVNVCSYPSAANGGNNDYNDCIVSPGGGFLEIVKVAPDGTTQQFDYTINPGGISESITGPGTTGPIPLLVGTNYSVTEGMLDDWQLDTASCEIKTDGTTEPTGTPITMGVENIEIRSGLETVCTFTNSLRNGTINIHKTTSPSGGAGFNFTDDIESPNSFTLNDGDVKTFSDVVSGSYAVTESDPGPAYSLTSLTCTDSDTGGTDSTWDLGTRTATINLDPGETVDCYYTNTAVEPQIRVIKALVPGTDSGLFDLAINSTDYVTDGGDGADTGFVSVASLTGNSVSETAGTGTSLSDYDSSISCDNGDSASGASLDLSALSYGDQVTCTITNQKDSNIIVEKQTEPPGAEQEFPFQASWLGDGSEEYDFTLSDNEQHGSGDLDPGTYSVSEVVPAGWDLDDVTCTSSKGDTETEASISLQAGETASCVVSNHQER
jgi:hypothetical protein